MAVKSWDWLMPTVALVGERAMLARPVVRSPQPPTAIAVMTNNLRKKFAIFNDNPAAHDGVEDFAFQFPAGKRSVFAFGGELGRINGPDGFGVNDRDVGIRADFEGAFGF